MKRKLLNGVLLLVSVVFSLLVLEVSLRAYKDEWRHTNFRFPWDKHDYPVDLDAELGWVPKQDVQRTPNTWGTTVTILKDGLRANGGGEAPDATDAILAVGDSFTFGAQVSDWETWPAQLENLLGARVINGGVNGYGIDQAFLRARYLLSRYRVSTVIFSFIPDDVRRCQWSGGKPYFDFEEGQLTLKNVPVQLPIRLAPKDSNVSVVLEHSLLVHSVMKRLFPEWWAGLPWTKVLDEQAGKKVACALLHELEKVTKSHGSALMILVQHAESEPSSASTAVESALSCLSDPGTRVIDLSPALSKVKAKDRSRYDNMYIWNMSDAGMKAGHMSAAGNQFVALEISKILSHQGGQLDRGVPSGVR